MSDMRRMDIGQIVDYCIEFNEAHETKDDKRKDTRRSATQADWNAFFG